MQYKLKKDKFVVHDPDDEVIVFSATNTISPDASFGLSLFHDNKFYIDIAIYQLLNKKVSHLNSGSLENRQARHYVIGAGYFLTINEKFRLEPSAMFKLTEKAMYQLAIVPYIGITTNKIALGYSYGIVLNDIAVHQLGTHEIMFILKINNAKTNLEAAE